MVNTVDPVQLVARRISQTNSKYVLVATYFSLFLQSGDYSQYSRQV